MSDICIIGGGHAAGRLVNNLQKLNYNGNIDIFSEENFLPYERPPLSKDFLLDEKNINDFQIDINLDKVNYYFNTKINKVDFQNKLIIDLNNKSYSYSKLIFANGSYPKRIFDEDIKGVHYLRNINDSINIKKKYTKFKKYYLIGCWIYFIRNIFVY